jgi:hypothetical protein
MRRKLTKRWLNGAIARIADDPNQSHRITNARLAEVDLIRETGIERRT